MNNVILFAGTTEGRQIAQACIGLDMILHVSTATEYGETMIEAADNIRVLHGRKNADEIAALIGLTGAELVIDATHPYAKEITDTLRRITKERGTEYFRVIRGTEDEPLDGCEVFPDPESAAAYLDEREGNVLLTTGSKDLAKFLCVKDWEKRLYARILPVPESIRHALDLGFSGSRLICMQGPFSEALNAEMLKACKARFLVTKESGTAGGFPEKIRAAKSLGVTPLVIARPAGEEGITAEACIARLKERFKQDDHYGKKVTVIGIGPGASSLLVPAAKAALSEADLIIGAKRVTDALANLHEPVLTASAAKETETLIRESDARRIVVAMSGDTGFFSGTKGLLPLISDLDPEVIPGVSSVSYFSSRIGISWDDALLVSVHGRYCNLPAKVRTHRKVFLLTGGDNGVSEALQTLAGYGFSSLEAVIGENLSYPEEKITRGTVQELMSHAFGPLALMYLENPDAENRPVTHGRADTDFLRADVPMTKSEVRAVTLAKLRLTRNAVCWDVGAGTGSVSLEMAECCEDGEVFAIERRPDACGLIEQNKTHLGITNVTIVCGKAPDCVDTLPAPTHVFIGGTGGNLGEILRAALRKNPLARIVLNTVTLETLTEAVTELRKLPVSDPEFVQISAVRAKPLAGYHLMEPQSPVFIISCTGEKRNA